MMDRRANDHDDLDPFDDPWCWQDWAALIGGLTALVLFSILLCIALCSWI